MTEEIETTRNSTNTDACLPAGCSTGEEPVVAEAFTKLNEGRRNLVCEEYPQAVESLAEACRLLAQQYGEKGDELAEPYFFYGKALLELARMENGVLGNALDGVPAEEEDEADLSESEQFEKASAVNDEERNELRTQIYDAMCEQKKSPQHDTNETEMCDGTNKKSEQNTADVNIRDTEKDESVHTCGAEGGQNEDVVEGDQDDDTAEGEQENDAPEGEQEDDASAQETGETTENVDEAAEEKGLESAEDNAETAEVAQEDGDNPDDVPNLQLAWEVLDLSKLIYQRKDDIASKLKTAEVFLALGEVSVESEQYKQAVQEFTSSLLLRQENLEADNRLIAETHYQLGTAYHFDRQYQLAVKELRTATSVLQTRISNIETLIEKAEKEEDKVILLKEMAELKQLLPEIHGKVEDTEDEKLNAEKMENVTTAGFGDAISDTATALGEKKVNDITNLVRKRKPEDQDEEELKKPKADDAYGDVTENGGAGDADVHMAVC